MKVIWILLVLISTASQNLSAQNGVPPDTCALKSMGDLFHGKNHVPKPPKDHYLIATPVITSSPATGVVFGVAGQYSFKGHGTADKFSVVTGNAQYTTLAQTLFKIRNNIFAFHDKVFFMGDMRVFLYSQPTYGLGTDALSAARNNIVVVDEDRVNPDSVSQPMKFNYFRIHQTASYQFSHNFFLGGGVAFDIYNNIKDEYLNLANGDTTFHYSYSVRHGFDTDKYYMNGLSINALYDTRDNQINSTRGIYANINWRYNPTFLGSSKNSSLLFAEFRTFKSFRVGKRTHHTIAFWLWGNYVTSGEVPYLGLPSIGWDQRNRSGRGYPQGMFRGESMMNAEIEYRFPLMCNQLLGAVVFVNATTASDRDRGFTLFESIQPAGGIGLRLNMNKRSRTNLTLDYAKGRKVSGFYLNAGEAF